MQIIVLLGPPAAGKGTQSAQLEKLGYRSFSFGAWMRAKAAAGDPQYVAIKKIADAGGLASDDVVVDVMEDFINDRARQGGRGVILDGTPRTLNQARLLDQLVARHGFDLKVVELVVSEKELDSRRLKRIADSLARGEVPRTDDDETAFRNRLAVYRSQTAPVAAHYAKQPGKLFTIDAEMTIPATWGRIQAVLGLKGPTPPLPRPAP